METQQRIYHAPDPTVEATNILRSLLRLEGAVIIEAIHQIIRTSDAEFNAQVAISETRYAKEDRAFGKNLKSYFGDGVRPRIFHLLDDIIKTNPTDQATALQAYLNNRSWNEDSYSSNKRDLTEIASNLRTLLDQL